MNIVENIRAENAGRMDGIAVVDGERQCTYGELLARVAEVKKRLAALGIAATQRIAFHCDDGIDYIVGSLALLGAGAALVPAATSLTPAEVADTVERIHVHGVLFGRDCTVREHGDIEIEQFLWRPLRQRTQPHPCDALNPAFIRFSSGTTGASKGVVLSHQSVFDRTEAANEGLGITQKDRILWVLSMSHHFVVSILLFLRKGAAIIIGHRAFPMSVIDSALRDRITFIYASPVHYQLLAKNGSISPESLSEVRLAVSTAMKLPSETAEAFRAKFDFELAEAYGIIEIGLPFINTNVDVQSRGSVGRILPAYELKLNQKDASGVGQVFVRGKGMFDAYFSPWQPRSEILEEGWFRTGDLGWLDGAGNLHLSGREKSVIICAGMKIFPAEVEEALNAHPMVAESLVYGIDHPDYGQIPAARIVPASGEETEEAIIVQLRKHCYAWLAAYNVPKEFVFVRSLPKTSSGKLLRR